MAVYDVTGKNLLSSVYTLDGRGVNSPYDVSGNSVELEQPEWTNENQVSTVAWYVNQIGYDTDKDKRATLTNGERGSTFTLHRLADDFVVYTGTIKNQIADFTDFTTEGEYYLQCGDVKSYDFKIAKNRIWNVAALPALDFMAQSRSDTFCVGANHIGWRDSHQFSFELNGLVMQYMSNPSYYKGLPYNIYHVAECEYPELQTQNEPDIIWLIKFGIMRYYKWNTEKAVTLHALVKGQVAYFLYLYPHISEYVDTEWYATIRDWIIGLWNAENCNTLWFEVDGGINHNLFATQEKIGTEKGQLPPGYAIVPNLMMHEVAKRDGLTNANDFLVAAFNNMVWLVDTVDLRLPQYTKGQRMSEIQGIHALTYFYEMYPDICPEGTYRKILTLAKTLISRSSNLWDFRQYRTSGDLSGSTTTAWCGGMNEPGNVAGFVGVAYSLARVIKDEVVAKRLRQIAVAHADNVFGRNPTGRCFGVNATTEYDGAKLGWFHKFADNSGIEDPDYVGPGVLHDVVGCLDGSPKSENYPYEPDYVGYTEGWVAFNSAWNMALAYLSGENAEITDGIGIFAK